MSIIPTNTDPSKDYVLPNVNPPLTINGLVYNKIYAHTGVIDSLEESTVGGYSDPNLNIINNSNGIITFTPQLQTSWVSDTDFGSPTSKPVVLTYQLSNTTYYNNITFNVLNVPCFVELLDNNMVALSGQSTFVVNGGNDINTTTDWVNLNFIAPVTITGTTSINLRITRNKTVEQFNSSLPNLVSVPYSVGVENFKIKLNIFNNTDIPIAVLSGTSTVITQNRFGIVESYGYSNNPVSNIFVNNSNYWRSSPQPTGDSIVYFYAEVSDPTATTINRLYINPLYSNCKFNIYYTLSSTSGGTIDPSSFTWTPIQRDFTLRKGIYELPDVFCTYLKFEFTKLVPEAYDLPFDVVGKTINIFPQDVEQYFSDLENEIVNGNSVKYSLINNPNISSQTQTSNNVSPATIFGASTNTLAGNNNWPSLSSLNNSQLGNTTTVSSGTASQIVDPTISYKLLDYNGDYNNQSYTQFLQRKFVGTRTHSYSQVTIQQSWHEAYFTGIIYLNAFYENKFDEIRTLSSSFIGSNNTTSGFPGKMESAVILNSDTIAVTPWVSTIDTFTSFNVAGLTTDWRSLLTQGNTISNDPTIMNSLTPSTIYGMQYGNAVISQSPVGTLGLSKIYSVSGFAGSNFGVRSAPYAGGINLINYNDANFIPTSGTYDWYGLAATTITGATIKWNNSSASGIAVPSGTASGITVSGGAYAVAYNFQLPNVFSLSGTAPYTLKFGTDAFGAVGYATYSPTSGTQYYFMVNLQTQASGTANVTMYSRFINPTTSGVIAGTTVTGTTAVLTSGINSTTVTGSYVSNYSSVTGTPSNTIQLVVSGTGSIPYQMYEMGAFANPTTTWVSPADRTFMRVSGAARMFLLNTNSGTYRASLIATDYSNTQHELVYKIYTPGSMPSNTWFDIELQGFTGINLSSFVMQVVQTNISISETFYISMLAPFYHPIRYEYTNTSGTNINGTTGWYPIAGGVNNPDYFINTVSGLPASGIQLRMTGLDPSVYISGVSVVPYYKQNPFYAGLEINYLSNSKTNELSARTNIENKPYFMLNKEIHPSVFDIDRVASTVIPYTID